MHYRYPLLNVLLPSRAIFDKYVDQIWASRWLSNQGPLVQQLEKRAAERYGVDPRQVLAVANATLGLMMSMRLQHWLHAVVVPSFTFPSTVQAMQWAGVSYRYGDIDATSLALHLNRPPQHALIYVLPFGCWIPEECHKLGAYSHAIVDAAASFGASLPMEWMLKQSSAVVMSLHATKPLGGDEGGLIFLRDIDRADMLREVRNFGLDRQDTGRVMWARGINAKMSETSAAMALARMDCWPEHHDRIHQVQGVYVDEARRRGVLSPCNTGFPVPMNFFPVYVTDPVEALKQLADRFGIQTRRYYRPMHQMPGQFGYEIEPLSTTESVANRLLLLPLHANFLRSDVEYILDSLDQLNGVTYAQ